MYTSDAKEISLGRESALVDVSASSSKRAVWDYKEVIYRALCTSHSQALHRVLGYRNACNMALISLGEQLEREPGQQSVKDNLLANYQGEEKLWRPGETEVVSLCLLTW